MYRNCTVIQKLIFFNLAHLIFLICTAILTKNYFPYARGNKRAQEGGFFSKIHGTTVQRDDHPDFRLVFIIEIPSFFWRKEMNLIQLNPYGISDLTDFETLSKDHDEYYPFSPQTNAIIDEKVVSFMLRLGYVYDYDVSSWFKLNYDGLYDKIPEELVKRDILSFLSRRAPSNVNIPLKNRDAILERLRVDSYSKSCAEKFEDFSINHDEYYVPPYHEYAEYIGDCLIPVKNGLINPATMELLPHCAYLLHHNVYNFDYEKLTEEEIFDHPAYEDYSRIIPDKDTLHFYLWWVGMVLFSPEIPRLWLFFYGNAGTGKTTLSLGLLKILSQKALPLTANMFKSRFITSSFVNKQLIVVDEMSNSEGLWDEGLIKQLTGGTARFTIEEKYKSPRDVNLTAKLLFIGNSYPILKQDNAIIDRFFIIPCKNKQEKTIRDLIVSDDYLNWLFNAAYHFYVVKHPHKYVKSLSELKTQLMLDEQAHYTDTDGFNSWMKDYLGVDILTVDAVKTGLIRQPSRDVYNNYNMFIQDAGGKPLTKMKFNTRLRLEYSLIIKQLRDGIMKYWGYGIEGDD